MWAKRSEMLAPLSDLVGECGETKTTRKNKVKKKPWHWYSIHQIAFDNVKSTIAKEVVLAYSCFSKPFEIYTDASTLQLGAVITQENRPVAFFSWKLSGAQSKYTITKLELLAIVETLKEFNGMLWGQRINVYTDHKNLTRDGVGLTSDEINTDWTAVDDRHKNQPKMFGRWQEEDGEEGRKGAGAGCQCTVSASKDGERWRCIASSMITWYFWLWGLSYALLHVLLRFI